MCPDPEFKHKNFWEVLADRFIDPRELHEIDLRATEFMKFMKTGELQRKRIKLQVEIFKIDCELENVAKGFIPHCSREEIPEKFDRLVAMSKKKAEKETHLAYTGCPGLKSFVFTYR